jgi:hypothetical protein
MAGVVGALYNFHTRAYLPNQFAFTVLVQVANRERYDTVAGADGGIEIPALLFEDDKAAG